MLLERIFKSIAQSSSSLDFSRIMEVSATPRLPKKLRSELLSRQEAIPGFDQQRINKSRILVGGAGGLGANICPSLVRIGVETHSVDHDIVEVSNLQRTIYEIEDVGKPKPHSLMNRVIGYAPRSMILMSFWMSIEEFAGEFGQYAYDAYCFGFDNRLANAAGASLALKAGKPAVFVNVSRDTQNCRVFIQRPSQACYLCYDSKAFVPEEKRGSCPITPAIVDILQVASGMAVRSAISEILKEPTEWNCRDFGLHGFHLIKTVKRNSKCVLCSTKE